MHAKSMFLIINITIYLQCVSFSKESTLNQHILFTELYFKSRTFLTEHWLKIFRSRFFFLVFQHFRLHQRLQVLRGLKALTKGSYKPVTQFTHSFARLYFYPRCFGRVLYEQRTKNSCALSKG